MSYETHDFYCLKCGNKGIPIMRSRGMRKEKFHRKKLYCIHCKEEVNHIECRTLDEKEKFKRNFEKGVYEDEAQESVFTLRSAWVG